MPTQAQRPRIPETSENQRKARMAWNGGKAGKSKPLVISPVVEVCHVEECGTPTDGPRPGRDMAMVAGSKDGAASHWYCLGRCEAIAHARADLRTGGHRQVSR